MSAASDVRRGDRVRLCPRSGRDIFDLALAGRSATVDAIEVDLEGKHYVAVRVDDDPGASMGRRRPGHRLFFDPDEVEVIEEERGRPVPRAVLVAGIGNIFLGDDGFGVEVAQRLESRPLPVGVRVADYGIRGYDLAYALLDDPDTTILIDACPRGEAPGTVYVIEPDLNDLDAGNGAGFDAHIMNPLNVLRLARSLGARLRNIVLVGCEPATLGPPEGLMGLSGPVTAAVDLAVARVETLVRARGDE